MPLKLKERDNNMWIVDSMRSVGCLWYGCGLASASWRLAGNQTHDLADANGEEDIN